MNTAFDFDDFLISPAIYTSINSRSEISIHDENGMLPIFTAPMFDVIDENNISTYNHNGIYGILPRKPKDKYTAENLISSDPKKFISVGLVEFDDWFCNKPIKVDVDKFYILIDIANGHMSHLHDSIKIAKTIYGEQMVLMVGNVAHELTYKLISEAGADYCRCSVGSGSVCVTARYATIGTPTAYLISKCFEQKMQNDLKCKIVADGGFRDFSDIIKSYALGADFVMIGSILNKAFESSAPFYEYNGYRYNEIEYCDATWKYVRGVQLYKVYRGMSTKFAQAELGAKELKTAEGIKKYNKVEYKLADWVKDFEHYLKSCMSYCDCRTLEEFRGNVELNFMSNNASNKFVSSTIN